ncbi:MAG: peroxidase-related enzyme [Terracidiphilus sp.]
MGLPEYEQIARSNRKSASSAPTNLAVIEESAATGEVAALYDYFRTHFGRPDVPGILKCFATHPPLLRQMMDMSESLIFADGHLSRKHKEMIATLVSAQNSCPYCADSHGYFLRVHGGSAGALCAIQAIDLGSTALTAAEQALLSFARKVNIHSHQISRADVEQLQHAGWSDLQVAETVHVAALFSTFNRVANGFGLESQGLLPLFDADTCDEQSSDTALERSSH